jgi:hypothetical protein
MVVVVPAWLALVAVSDTGGLGPRTDRAALFGPSGDDFTGRLARWAAEARADDAATTRARERWLRQQATESATLAGILVDAAEQGAAVTVYAVGGTVHRGRLTAVGRDVLALHTRHGEVAYVALAAVEAVATGEAGEPTGAREPASAIDLAGVFGDLAAERLPVCLTTRGGTRWSGVVTAAGADVATLRPDAGDAESVHVHYGAVVDVICR